MVGNCTVVVLLVALVLGFGVRYYKSGCTFHYEPSDPRSVAASVGTVLITGGNVGIGLETARGLVRWGIHVVLACRDAQRCQQAREQLLKESPQQGVDKIGEVDVEELDLMSLAAVRDSAQRVIQRFQDLRMLINNAGIMAVDFGFTPEGHETHFGVNHLGHFLLTKLLLPHMKVAARSDAAPVRVINLSSKGHSACQAQGINFEAPGMLHSLPEPSKVHDTNSSADHYGPFNAYSQSKLANVLHARELAKREGDNVLALSLHPGLVGTELGRHFNVLIQYIFVHLFPRVFAKTPWEGAQTSLHCALEPALGQRPLVDNGAYFHDCLRTEPTWPKPAADDVDAYANRLWELSERLTAEFA